MNVLAPGAARRVFWLLTATRWLPVGLLVAILLLWGLEQGLSETQVLSLVAVQAVVIALLELPTSGFADSFGRRPVLVAAAVASVISSLLLVLADSFAVFAVAMVVQGVFRALDSGPLEAWFVDMVHAHRPGADVDQELSRAGTVVGLSIAAGALVSGLLLLWDPLAGSALRLPLLVSLGLSVLHLAAVAVLLREPPRPGRGRARDSVLAAPRVVRDGVRLALGRPVLLALLGAEAAVSLAMIGFESMVPLRLADVLGDEADAGALMSPVAAVGWGVYGVGAAVGGRLAARWGVARAAALSHVLLAAGVVGIGLAVGPVGLVVGYLFTYGVLGAGGPLHAALVHREAEAANRSTVLSLGSLTSFVVLAVAAPLSGLLAEAASLGLAVVVLGSLAVCGAPLYLPALRAEDRGAEERRAEPVSPAGRPAGRPGSSPR